jgi:hypothetical protein
MGSHREVTYVSEDHCYVFQCPHCDCMTQVAEQEVNCQIFRHGTMKSTGQQVNPHAPKEHCDRLVAQDLVYGCCKPFRLTRNSIGVIAHAEICDYI